MLLKLENICASIGDKQILDGINLEVNPGEVHVVMGPNGSGKSTLANVIMNTGGYTVDRGRIIVMLWIVLGISLAIRNIYNKKEHVI